MKIELARNRKIGSENRGVVTTIFLVFFTFFLLAVLPAWAGDLSEALKSNDIIHSKLSNVKHLIKGVHIKESSDDQGKKYKEDEILVKFKAEASERNKTGLHKKHGSEKIREFSTLHIHHVKLKKGVSVKDAIKLYQEDPDVEYAEPNYRVTVQATPNDPLFGQLWGLNNTGLDADIDAPEAWDITKGSSNVVVAVIDTGVDYNHQDLAVNIWKNTGEIPGNGIDDDGNGYVDDVYGIDAVNYDRDPFDDHGHGTHVSGTIGAVGNNNIGVAGVNWNIKIMPCKFLDSGGYGYMDGAVQCLNYIKKMKDRGVNVVATSNSWGCDGSGCYSQVLYDAIHAQQDILFIAAAGNSSMNLDQADSFPAKYDLPNVIAVAAIDSGDALAYFSSFGKQWVHVGAPGVSILSTLPAANIWNISGGYGYLSGTSMATPHVSGLAGLLKAQDQSRDSRVIKNLILYGSEPTNALRDITVMGGRINANNSVRCDASSAIPRLKVLKYPENLSVGTPVTLSALSIRCGSASGPVTVTLSGGEVIDLHDDGVAPDLAAGDGIFSATWTPIRYPEKLIFSTPGAAPIAISVPSLYIAHYLPEANRGVPYHQHLTAVGAKEPYSWSLLSGSLPPGLTLDSSTGEISGTATSTGTFSFTVQVSDGWGISMTRTVPLRVSDGAIREEFARTLHGDTGANGRDIVLDASGNIHILGTLSGHNYIAKYDASGTLLWLTPYETGYLRAIALDAGGNIYAAGGTAEWDTGDTLVVKFDSSGNKVWEKTYNNGQRTDVAMDIALDKNGNIYLGGIIEPTYTYTMYVQKISPSGSSLWIQTYSQGMADQGYSIAVDNAGNVILGGSSAIGVPDQGGTAYWYDTVIRKYDPSGNLIWHRTYDTGSRYDFLSDLKVDGNGNIYVLDDPEEGAYTGFVTMKYSPAGDLLWVRKYQSISHYPAALAVDQKGNVYATGGSWQEAGTSDWDFLTLKYDPSGNLLWKKVSDSGYYLSQYDGDFAYGIAVDNGGNAFVIGSSNNGVGSYDMLMIKYSEAFNIATGVLPAGVLSTAYSQTLTATGGVQPYTWSITEGGLPPGLSLNSGTGQISGIATAAGVYTFTAQVTDANTAICAKTFTLTITSASLIITTPSLATGLTGISYQETLTAAGGTPPYTWSISSGSLPPGLYLTSSTGAILGAPNTAGTFSFTAKVTDANSTVATRDFSIAVYEPLYITTPGLPDGAIGVSYNQTLTASGGTPPYTWSIIYGALPAGITLNTSTGLLSGIPVSAGTFSVTMQVMDAKAGTNVRAFSLFIAGSPPPGNGLGAWGLNMYGQLGDGTTISRETPGPVAGISEVIAVAAPMDSSLALRSDGTVWQWGSNNDAGPRGPNTYRTVPMQVPGLFGITSITGGWFHSLALRADGTVWAWGANNGGQLGDGTYEYRAVPVQVFGFYGATAVAGGDAHSLALKADGTVWAWGGNYNGQLGDGTNNWTTFPVQVVGLSDVIAIAAGVDHSLALKADGTVWAWGGNGNGQLGDGTNINRNYPAQVPILNGVRAIAGGGWHSVALDNNGIVWTWGRNDSGQLGDGLAADRYFAMPVSGLPPVTAIGAKCFRTVAVSYDGFLWTWGMAYTRSSIVPMPMPGISGVSSAAAGMDHTLVLQMTAPPVPHFIITATAGPSGSISPSGLMSVPSGSTQTFTVTPNAGYYPVMSGTCGGTLSGTGSNYTYTTNPVAADCSVQADFALSSVLVTPSAGIAGTENVYQYETQWASQGGGLAVDASGNIYVSYTAGYLIQKFNSSGTLLMQWSAPSGGGGSGYIHDGLAVDASGNVYTALSYDNNIYKFDSNGTHLTHWGSVGTGNGQFNTPTGVVVDTAGNVYVVDSGNDRVQKFDSNGTYLTQWGSSGTGNGQFNEPIGVAVDGSGNVYVSDLFASRIQKFDSNGMYLAQWSTIWGPDGITTDSFGNIYVAGALSDRMQKLDSNGTSVTEWGSSGTGNGQFTYIQGVDVDMSRNIYVADGFNRVQKFRSVYSGTSSAGGRISPDTSQTVNPNGTISFTITPNAGYRIESVTGCGGTLSGNVYTIASVTSDCTVKASFVMIPETSRPDLLVSSLTVPTAAGAGAIVTITDTTKNNGPGTSTASTTWFYLSTDTSLDAADALLGSRAMPGLSAGATSAGTTSVTIPTAMSTGTYYIIAKADGDEVIAEVNESNNTKSSGLIKIGPDLSVSALTVPGTAGAGAIITVTDTTKNSGAGEAGASTTSFYLSADTTFDAGDALIGSRSVGAIAGASSSQGTAIVTIPGGIASGTYYIIARADDGSAVVELNEDNNTLYRSINIGPDLTMSAVTVPTAAGAGTTLTINDTTKNNGPGTAGASVTRFYLSTDTSLDSADTQLGSRAVPELSAGATSSGTTPVTIPTGTATGTYYVIAKADGDDLVAEVNELNNTKSSGSIKIGPDLIISALTVPSTAGAGVSITVTDTTKNSGAGEGGASTTSFYLSADATLDAGDALIGSRSVGPIAGASSSQGTATVTIPGGIASGTYYIIARADAGSAVSELNEDNNTLYRSINIGPDLTMSTVTVPSAAGAGKGISITDTTKNNGPGTAAASTTRFYLSTDTSLDGNDTLLGNRALPTLAAGATNTGTTTVIIPTGTPTGAYYVIAKADADEMIAEVNESNNAKSSGLIKIGPDLVVSAVAVPSTAGAGKSISITDTTKNNGAGDADPTTTNFYLSTDSTLDSNDVFLGSRAAGSLAAGATNQGTTSVTIPENTASGAYYIIAKADAGNTVPEINEDNNTYFKTVTIGPDLAVSSLTAPSTAGAGKNINITETTKNNGPGDVGASTTIFYLSTDTTVDANDALLGSRSVAALTAGTSSAGSTSVTIPAGIASGMYYIIAQADGGTVVREINENNNTFSRSINIGLDLVVSAVTAPSTAGAGTSISITDTTKNNGPGDIGTSATGIYLSTDSMLDGSDLLLGSRAVPDLVAGATNAGTTAVTIPAGTTAGTYYIIIKADKDDAIAELNEYNNTLLKTVIVK